MTQDKKQDFPPFKQVYLYDPETNEHKGPYSAQLSPLDKPGTYLTPVHHTEVCPPPHGPNQVPVFSNGVWALQPDFRGETWFDQATGTPIEIQDIGEPAKNLGRSYTPPPPTPEQLKAQAAAQVDAVADPVLRSLLIAKGLLTQDDIDSHRDVVIGKLTMRGNT